MCQNYIPEMLWNYTKIPNKTALKRYGNKIEKQYHILRRENRVQQKMHPSFRDI